MKELLRIGMTPQQVREACEQWAIGRTSIREPATAATTGIADDCAVQVIFTKKRVRNSTKEKAA